jgi:hypothetical protein
MRMHNPPPKFSCFELTTGRDVPTLTERRLAVIIRVAWTVLVRTLSADSASRLCVIFAPRERAAEMPETHYNDRYANADKLAE